MPKKPTIPAGVDAYTHDAAKRVNIPTAENQGLVPDEDKAQAPLRIPRNPDLDPQLAWRGKDAEDEGPLVVQAPPVYIQEKIHPRALIEDLRRRSQALHGGAAEAQFDFFHDFNGLPEGWKEDATESYYHDEGNWQNRMILGDSLLVMASLLEREKSLRGQVQCIYFDPPYGIKFNSNWQPSTKSREVKDGKEESVSREPEVVRAFRDTWRDGIHSYLSYIRDRLTLARELLADSGSIFVQIGDENVHRVRAVMDEVFGAENFVSQIAFVTTTSQTSRFLPPVVDFVLWYSRKTEKLKAYDLLVEKDLDVQKQSAFALYEKDGAFDRKSSGLDGERLAVFDNLTSRSGGGATVQPFHARGRMYRPSSGGWKTSSSGLARLDNAGRIGFRGEGAFYVRYFDDFPYVALNNVWRDTQSGGIGVEPRRYVVQTNTKVIERCILMATDPGDLVLDPTCGSGTTAYVAEQWGRRWITIDTSRVALTLARARLMGARYDFYPLKDSPAGDALEAKQARPNRVPAPFGHDIRHGFVYERAPHVTLKSIANNAAIDVIWERFQERLEPLRASLNAALGQAWEEWQVPREAGEGWPDAARETHAEWWRLRRERQAEIDRSIADAADVELLYDRPLKAKGVVRVAGPFTVESLSPHRVLALEEDPALDDLMVDRFHPVPGDEEVRYGPAGSSPVFSLQEEDFAAVVRENLLAAGVQNMRKGETLRFEWLKPRVSRSGLVPLEGRYLENGETRRVAVCIGPEYDTVGYDLVRRAAKEAADLFDTLVVCGFAFAPEVDESRLNFGDLVVLKARMNQDLRMGDRLKATTGNLFVVFGEPEIEILHEPGGLVRVAIKGMDIFDPTTGEVRSSGGSDLRNDIAAWFIDDDYDEESFFVRQAYFLGDDPYESLRRTLKAEIHDDVWSELASTTSRPFPRPPNGLICVKVINHFGDEVQKVFRV